MVARGGCGVVAVMVVGGWGGGWRWRWWWWWVVAVMVGGGGGAWWLEVVVGWWVVVGSVCDAQESNKHDEILLQHADTNLACKNQLVRTKLNPGLPITGHQTFRQPDTHSHSNFACGWSPRIPKTCHFRSTSSLRVGERSIREDYGIANEVFCRFYGDYPPKRDYDKETERRAGVENFYKTNHINQTYEFVTKKKEEFGKLNRAEMSIWECCELLNEIIDESDPDLDEPQIEHLLQTAEAIRKDYPNEDWLHLTGLIHGDTFPLGCAFDESIVYHKYFAENPDSKHPIFSTRLGIYKENCGLENVTISWGHDDYMYMVMKENKTTLPSAGLFIVRFHSFYPLHRNGAYSYLMNEEDKENLKWLKIFK
ncbi:hypothetical protein Vadar_023137 [Vaccinium darrowii]|uniref:Uncharacterized protein n=1 Tax=Vaccinium darrowii TaxID=229202 RepID=A0ACB7X374_9ERIC|nr:hypothetical protein Vadar_023137 [Vaccinium darrowii]